MIVLFLARNDELLYNNTGARSIVSSSMQATRHLYWTSSCSRFPYLAKSLETALLFKCIHFV